MTQHVLHLGLHRTATTTLQDMAEALAPQMAAHGIVLLTPDRFTPDQENLRAIVRASRALEPRHRKWRSILRRRFLRRDLQARLTTLVAQGSAPGTAPRRIVLSEEMMLGAAFGRRGQSFYPEAERHLRAIRQVLDTPVAEVHVTLRSYDSFLTSVFAMRAVNAGNVAPFEVIGPRLSQVRMDWPHLIDLIRNLIPEARLVLRNFEDSTPEARLADLLGGPLPDGTHAPVRRHLHRSPTTEAIEAAIALGRRPDDPAAFTARYADGTRFDPLTDAQKESLQQRYRTDLQNLRARRDIDFR